MSTSDVGKKKTRPARGDLCPPVTWAKKKTRPARGDLCPPVTWAKKKNKKKKKQDPLGETYVSPRDVGKKNKAHVG